MRAPDGEQSLNRPIRDTLGIGAVVACMLAVLIFFAWPWRAALAPRTTLVDLYAPVVDGDARLIARFEGDASGRLLQWESANIRLIPALNLYSDLNSAAVEVIERAFLQPRSTEDWDDAILQELAQLQIFELRQRTRSAAGVLSEQSSTGVHSAAGLYLVEYRDPATSTEWLFDPPLPTFPNDLLANQQWKSEGTLSAGLPYHAVGRLLEAGPHVVHGRRFDDCLLVELNLSLGAGETATEFGLHTRYCAGVGAVSHLLYGGDGALLQTTGLVSSERTGVDRELLAALRTSPIQREHRERNSATLPLEGTGSGFLPGFTSIAPAAVAELVHFTRLLPDVKGGDSTFTPVWIEGQSPFLLAMAYQSDLVALDRDGTLRWRFYPGSAVYGTPIVDAASGTIFFGSTDRRLYALTTEGQYLWSMSTGDNVATQPLVVADLVYFGSEDRTIYALEVATGALRWQVQTGGPVTADPESFYDMVLFGSDDGVVYALEQSSGNEVWQYATGGAIEAALQVAQIDGRPALIVASRDGTLAALDQHGVEIWKTHAGTGDGSQLHAAPAVGAQTLYLRDEGGILTAFELATGEQRWATETYGEFSNPPLVVPGADEWVIIARWDAVIHAFGAEGQVRKVWPSAVELQTRDTLLTFYLRAGVGGDSVWLADDRANIFRLGPPRKEAP